jgi:hypothetical protein
VARYRTSFDDLVGRTPRPMSRAWPARDAIDRMEATFDWRKWLEPVDRKIVTMRASGERWKNVCWKIGLSRPAAWQHWSAALCVIAMRLNGERVRACGRWRCEGGWNGLARGP